MDPNQAPPPQPQQPQAPVKEVPATDPTGLEHITQELYKKNMELNARNKTLSLLQKIDEIILSSVTDTAQTAQQVANVVAAESGFKFVEIFIVNKTENDLLCLAMSETDLVKKAEGEFNRIFNGLKTPLAQDTNLAVRCVKERKVEVSHDLFELLTPYFSQEESKKVGEITGVIATLAYPLIVREEIIGAIAVGFAQREETLTAFDRDLLARLTGLIGIAIDNALLYQSLKEANEKLNVLAQKQGTA